MLGRMQGKRRHQALLRHAAAAGFALALAFPAMLPAQPLAIPEQQQAKPDIELPARGTSMQAVQSRHGQPSARYGPVGGDRPQHPPITRWEYGDFFVVFENDRVINAGFPERPRLPATTDGMQLERQAVQH